MFPAYFHFVTMHVVIAVMIISNFYNNNNDIMCVLGSTAR